MAPGLTASSSTPDSKPVKRSDPPEPLLSWRGHARCRRKVSQLLRLRNELTAVDNAGQEGMHHGVCCRPLRVDPLPRGLLAQRLQVLAVMAFVGLIRPAPQVIPIIGTTPRLRLS